MIFPYIYIFPSYYFHIYICMYIYIYIQTLLLLLNVIPISIPMDFLFSSFRHQRHSTARSKKKGDGRFSVRCSPHWPCQDPIHWRYRFHIYLVAHPTNRKWVITPVINGIRRVNPLIIGVITHLLSGMSHQVRPMFQGYVREYPHKIWPEIWY